MAEECEKAESPKTCACIIRTVIGMNIDKEDRKRTWLADAEVCCASRCRFVGETLL
jgi:pre-mRNA-processing factor 6